jgi:predicted RNase H-like HicB family nuclease
MKKKSMVRECNVSIVEDDEGFVAICEELDIECYGETPEEALESLKSEISSILDEQLDYEVIHDSLKDQVDLTIHPISQIGDA